MDAVDGSLAMLEKLKEKNIYGKVYQAVLGKVFVLKSCCSIFESNIWAGAGLGQFGCFEVLNFLHFKKYFEYS